LSSKLGSGLGEDTCVNVGETKLIGFIFGGMGEVDNDGGCDGK